MNARPINRRPERRLGGLPEPGAWIVIRFVLSAAYPAERALSRGGLFVPREPAPALSLDFSGFWDKASPERRTAPERTGSGAVQRSDQAVSLTYRA
ncbi:hypothetical protein GCM10011574_60760 [Microbispora bryophytorum]|uniref:Uncharacterized protein n=1 Tax=Microbispora bryophytorum TaxID=1460882 RepID=A0A8H9H5D8_9ACTN|nr:hypothetical protein GCM10011574_60760 [Microbispora bryophytorum]